MSRRSSRWPIVVDAFGCACNYIFAPLHLDALADGLQIAAPLWDGGLAVSEGHIELVQFVEETEEKGAKVGGLAGFHSKAGCRLGYVRRVVRVEFDIEADADDCVAHVSALEGVFDEMATDFAASNENVVGPT